ncbi:26S proteasome regulatory subunit RPN11-like [Selaginella moellendorffii]|uniref:26S proteasome regulatory subunit RPN11-like n=1 Tax=Selaginella moellendorffii TaxID=88036 RepID=UPI000D1C7B87|nr:26S proteasome regulatory subunit RPN11-like [Selaginella moellendorffii]|eukprot:XP_024534908.1 26S proteasome regulatory subunit RPN11-like [Selaginella moellendorffii]
MGLMLGDFVDEYTVWVINVFTMPQNGTGVSMEAVDLVFQTKMMDMLKQIGSTSMTNPKGLLDWNCYISARSFRILSAREDPNNLVDAIADVDVVRLHVQVSKAVPSECASKRLRA